VRHQLEFNMTKRINHAWTAAALAICAIAGSAPAVADDGNGAPKCGPRTLDGSYVLAASGFAIPAAGAQPKALIEQIDFDGAGHAISPHAANSMNGTIGTSTGGAANYYDLGDCTFRIEFANGPVHLIYMDPDGDKGWTLLTAVPNNVPQVFQGTLTRVWPRRGRDDGH
jgi:hypothetical protein